MRYLVTLCILALSVACGGENGNPIAPTPPAPAPAPTVANVAGAWTGRITARHPDAGTTSYSITVTLQQAGDQITGTWQDTSGRGEFRGEISGTLSGFGTETRITGSSTWDAETDTGVGRCFGRADISGPASPPSMTWVSQDVSFTTCSGTLTDVRWTLSR